MESTREGSIAVTVASGSPRGESSLTLRFARLMCRSRGWRAEEVMAGSGGPRAVRAAVDATIAGAERGGILLFCYPVYSSGVPSQYMRYLEALAADPRASRLRGASFAQVLTSKRFYDVTAMDYVRATASDLGMRDLGALSADPEDFRAEEGRRRVVEFAENVEWACRRGVTAPEPRSFRALPATIAGREVLTPREAVESASTRFSETGPRVLALCDDAEARDPAGAALASFLDALAGESPDARVELADLASSGIRAGCAGCLRCALSGHCPIDDGYGPLMERVLRSDAIVNVSRVRGRWFDPVRKRFDDRAFRFGHRLSTRGKPVAWIVSGPYDESPHLGIVVESRAHLGGNPLVAVVAVDRASEDEASAKAREGGIALARELSRPSTPASSFWSVGGMRIFRDLVFEMRGFMREDHRYYRAHGLYDFPHARKASIARGYLAGAALSIPAFREKALPRLAGTLASTYDDLLERHLAADRGNARGA